MAQRGVNKVIILGRLGKDPEVRHLNGGNAVCSLTIATSESWNDRNTGEKKEQTEWHKVVIFGKLAEIAGEYLEKGSEVYVEGKLQTRKWQAQDGTDRYSTEITIPQIGGVLQIIKGKARDGSGQAPQQQQQQQQSQPKPKTKPQKQSNKPPVTYEDDDIPF